MKKISALVFGILFAAELFAAPSAAVRQAADAVSRYLEYSEKTQALPGEGEYTVPGEAGTVLSGEAEVVSGAEYRDGAALSTQEGSAVKWRVEVQTTGLYHIELRVSTRAAKKSAAQRMLSIDGGIPFEEARELTFYRRWRDQVGEEGFAADRMGNQLRPDAEAVERLEDQALCGAGGEAYRFYLEAGAHELMLTASKELLIIDAVTVKAPRALPAYAQIKEEYRMKGLSESGAEPVVLEAEKPSAKSDYSIHPAFDRTSAAVSPQSASALMLNTIGGSGWQTPGQWIEWTVNVAESGLYRISFRYKQSALRGLPVMRALSVDGEVPFAEASKLRFPYGGDWQTMTAASGGGEPYLFYLEAGKRIFRLKVVLGDFEETVGQVRAVLERLNRAYRNILSVTGPAPDVNRDYDFEKTMPEVLAEMASLSAALKNARGDLYALAGEKGEMLSMLETMYAQLDRMTGRPYEIARQFAAFKSNISALGNWVYQITNQPLVLDCISVSGKKNVPEKGKESFFNQLFFNVRLFVCSFLLDYNTVASHGDPLEVWVPTGRDQWQIISTLADNDFTVKTNIPVTVKLVAPTALLPSVLAGRGPDAALSNAQNIPVDYAARSAAAHLSSFSDIGEVTAWFADSALTPFYYDGKLCGLPESQVWPMLFFREDVLGELGVPAPKTWDEVVTAIPTIKRRNMEFGMLVGYPGFLQLLYQHGGALYREGSAARTALDSNAAVAAFERLCNLFTQYRLPIEYDAANRFRSGEMPILIADYSFYNQLTVFAPEIRGLWRMSPVPGVKKADGTVDNSVVSTSTAAIILKTTKKADQAWEFLKWWTSADTQAAFGVEMEVVLGPSAKQPTANLQALGRLPWTAAEYAALQAQQSLSVGIPVVPGHYQAERLVGFAFNNVYNTNAAPAEKLEDIILSVNTELARRQAELSGSAAGKEAGEK